MGYDAGGKSRIVKDIHTYTWWYIIPYCRVSVYYAHAWYLVVMLGAICGSAISMDLLAQSMDPYSAQKSMDCADICGSSYAVHEFCV